MQSGYILTPLTPLHCVRSILMYNTMHFLFSFLTCTSQSYVIKEKEEVHSTRCKGFEEGRPDIAEPINGHRGTRTEPLSGGASAREPSSQDGVQTPVPPGTYFRPRVKPVQLPGM